MDTQPDIQALVHQHHAAVYRYAFRLTGRQADAEDLAQQTFLQAQRKLHQLREPKHATAWLFAILRSLLIKSRRRNRPMAAADAQVEPDLMAAPEAPEEVDSERLQAALSQLPDEHRTIVLMFYMEELSYKESAEALDVPMGTVMSRLSRAKSRLRELLKGYEL